MTDTEFNVSDVRDFLTDQLNRDMQHDDYLSVDEYRWFMAQLVQVEIAEQLKRLADLLDGFRMSGFPVENIH